MWLTLSVSIFVGAEFLSTGPDIVISMCSLQHVHTPVVRCCVAYAPCSTSVSMEVLQHAIQQEHDLLVEPAPHSYAEQRTVPVVVVEVSVVVLLYVCLSISEVATARDGLIIVVVY